MKIPVENLADLDLDKLFREHTVAEIDKVQKEVQNEIEKKREELRTTVGERYRDLLRAADTITEMKGTANDVLVNIKRISSMCQTLQEKYLLGFKQADLDVPHRNIDSDHISKILEVRLMLALPEQIWTAIDNKHFEWAAEIYLLAAYTHLDLKVAHAETKYPIINMLWKTLSTCRRSILESSYKRIQIGNLTAEESCDCLTSSLLLEGTRLEEQLDKYLLVRTESCQHTLTSDEYPTVKDKLHAAVLLIQSTLIIACSCFLGVKDAVGLVEKRIQCLISTSSPTTLSKLPAVSPLIDPHLNSLIKEFRPKTPHAINSLSLDTLRSKLKSWLETIQQLLSKEMPSALSLINNLRGVLSVRERVSGITTPSTWSDVEAVLGEPYPVFTLLVEPHVTARTLQLVAAVWDETLKSCFSALSSIESEIAKNGGGAQPENDLRWYIWKDSESEEVALKTRGLTPRILQVCKILDTGLATLLEDVNIFLNGTDDKVPLLEFLNSTTYDHLNRFAKTLEDISTLKGKSVNESAIIFRARLLQAVLTQCSHLKKCLRQVDPKSLNGQGRTWAEVNDLLLGASTSMWRSWKDYIKQKIEALIREKLDGDVTASAILLSRPACDVITITEEAEDNKAVISELRVPSQPSFTLQELLLQISLLMNAVVVHTLPRSIHQELIQMIMDLILDHFEGLCSSSTIYQSHAWQLLLDIRFLALLFIPRDNQTRSQNLCSKLEGLIDPFDVNVCYPYVQANVKKSALRLQGTYGVLVDYTEKLAVLNSLKVAPEPQNTNSSPEDPNVAAMSNGTPWFPLLPISSGTNRKKESPSKHSKEKDKENKKESASSDFVRSAGAFFGAMTGGWS